MEKITNLFTELIKAELCTQPPQLHKEELTPELMISLYRLSAKHDLTHMVAVTLRKHGLLGDDEISQAYLQQIKKAAFRHETMNYGLQKIRQLFESEGIVFVPLKGAVLSQYYPEDWMRTRSDLDVLVKEEDLKRAKDLLITKLGYRELKENYHDIALMSPENILLELHFRILEHQDNIDKMLERVWDYVYPVAEGCYEHRMTDEFLMFHVYAHMYYHFMEGGCGLRFLVDIWLMKQKMTFQKDQLQNLYKVCRLETFVGYVEKLTEVCFGQGDHDEITAMMEEYIMTGGLFGSFENKIRARKTKTELENGYMLKRVFLPYKTMCESYPVLEKHPLRYPYYMVKRWLKILKPDVAQKATREVVLNMKMKKDSVNQLQDLFAVLKGEQEHV